MTTSAARPVTPSVPTVRVTADPYTLPDRCGIRISVTMPPAPDWAARIAQRGVPSVRPAAVAAVNADSSVKRWRVLGEQVTAYEQRVAAAEKVIQRVATAQALLEMDPQPDLANKLREVAAQLGAAQADKAAAERDLAEIRHLIAKHWVPAANVVSTTVNSIAIQRIFAIDPHAKVAKQDLGDACQWVAEVVPRAIAEILTPAATEYLVANGANSDAFDAMRRMIDELRDTLVGPMPAGVRPADPSGRRFELIPPEVPKVEDVESSDDESGVATEEVRANSR